MKSSWVNLALLLVVIVAVPLAINLLFKVSAPFWFLEAEWSPGELLGYCAGILAAVATFYAVYLTGKNDREARKEDARLAVIPCLVPVAVCRRPHPKGFDEVDLSYDDILNDVFSRQERPHVIVVGSSGSLSYSDSLKEEELDELKCLLGIAVPNREARGLLMLQSAEGAYFFFDYCNRGNGPAVNVSFNVDRRGEEGGLRLTTEPVTLSLGDKYSVLFLVMSKEQLSVGGYLAVRYSDVLGNRYIQKFEYGIKEVSFDDGTALHSYFDLNPNRELVSRAGEGDGSQRGIRS